MSLIVYLCSLPRVFYGYSWFEVALTAIAFLVIMDYIEQQLLRELSI